MRFGDGTDPAYGSNVVFAVNEQYIIKLYRTFLLAYGYTEAQINEPLSHRLMAHTLLHRYRPLNRVREAFAKQPCSSLEELARAIYAL